MGKLKSYLENATVTIETLKQEKMTIKKNNKTKRHI